MIQIISIKRGVHLLSAGSPVPLLELQCDHPIERNSSSSNTSPILFVGSIVCSMIAILGYLRWKDAREGRHRSKLAHAYIAPALIALAVLTFYPVIYGIWLSFTDANQTHLGDQSWIGLENFGTVLTSAGFLRVTLFTLVWTITNVAAHIGIGLALALVLNNPHVKGRTAYRTALLLPWAIPSYICGTGLERHVAAEGLVDSILGRTLKCLQIQAEPKP